MVYKKMIMLVAILSVSSIFASSQEKVGFKDIKKEMFKMFEGVQINGDEFSDKHIEQMERYMDMPLMIADTSYTMFEKKNH